MRQTLVGLSREGGGQWHFTFFAAYKQERPRYTIASKLTLVLVPAPRYMQLLAAN